MQDDERSEIQTAKLVEDGYWILQTVTCYNFILSNPSP